MDEGEEEELNEEEEGEILDVAEQALVRIAEILIQNNLGVIDAF